MTAHWIEVKDGRWKMRAAVIGFKAISGSHSGENLGRYAVGLLDRVGIMSKTGSKASICVISFLTICVDLFAQLYTATLDNTSNNDTTCQTIANVHTCRGLAWNNKEQQLPYVQVHFLIICVS